MLYIKGFSHTNTSDEEEEVVKITSTPEEPKRVKKVVITHRITNDGILNAYIEREKVIANVEVKDSPFDGKQYEFDVDADLPEGQSFTVTLRNKTAGSNAGIVGYVAYEITS